MNIKNLYFSSKRHYKIVVLLLLLLLVSCNVNIDPSVSNTPFGMQALHYEFIIVLISLIGGFGCIIAGVVLTIMGFTGNIEWFVEAVGFTSRLTNASPGIVLIIVGCFIVVKSRMKVKSVKQRKGK